MDNPDKPTTTINVKKVSLPTWKRALELAARNDETMGERVSRALDVLARMESGQREIPPGKPVKPTAELLAEVAPVVAGNMASLTREARSAVSHLIDSHIRDAQGLPPRPVRVPPGKAARIAEAKNGQAGLAAPAPLPALTRQ